MPDIVLKNIVKKFGKSVAVENLSLDIADRDFITLLGPSGCGKTTTLRMIAGLENPTSGEILIGGVPVWSTEKGINVPPDKRNVGFLFQNYALWPHMTVRQNISFGLENLKWSKERIAAKLKELLEMLKIEAYVDRYPSELSGGQQQRVAIARTLATEPRVLFMDEPLSNLDAKLRMDMRTELKRLHLQSDSTFVYVTHDQLEAMMLSTKICLLKDGLLQQYAPPLTVYNEPANTFVGDFVGNPAINYLEGEITGETGEGILISADKLKLSFTPSEKCAALSGKKSVILGIRPEYVDIGGGEGSGTVWSVLPSGMETIVKVEVAGTVLTAVVFAGVEYKVGQELPLGFSGENCMLFDGESKALYGLGRLKILK